jgi:hypothetical protein
VKATEHEPGQAGPASRMSRRCLVLVLSLTSVVIAFSGLTAASAYAHTTRFLMFSFASGTDPGASAVDQSTGDVYVIEHGTEAIAKFDANGNPVAFSGLLTNTLPASHAGSIAVDPVSHDIYVSDSVGVERFQSSGQPAPYTAGPDAGTNVLSGVQGALAVDSSGDLYVSVDTPVPAATSKYLSSGEFSGLQFPGGFAIAVAVNSSGDVYVNEQGIDEFNPLAQPISTLEVGEAHSLAIDPQTNSVFVSHGYKPASISQFSSSGSLELEFGGHILATSSGGYPLSLNSAIVPNEGDDRVYVTDEGAGVVDVFSPAVNVPTTTVSGVSGLGLGTVTLNGTVNTDGTTPADALTGCHFDYVTQAAFEADVKAGRNGFSDLSSGGSVPCTPGFASIPDDGKAHAVSAAVSGLAPNATYRYRLLASNEHGADTEFQQLGFETAGPPTIDQAYATEVSSSSARLSGEVNPHQLDTTYRFEYVDLATYEADVQASGPGHGFDRATVIPSAAGGDLGSGATDALASAPLDGLAPDTTYHYRVVATNQAIPAGLDGPDLTFTTQLSGGLLSLPDGRAWEQVTPVEKHGAGIEPIRDDGGASNIQAAGSGDAITYSTDFPFEANPRGYDLVSQNISRRGPAGWSTRGIDSPHPGLQGGGASHELGDEEYLSFSADDSLAVLQPLGHPFVPLASLAPDEVFPPDTEKTLYLRHDSTCEATPATCYTPLVTAAPGYADVQPGTKFGGDNPVFGGHNLTFAGASPDLRHLVLASSVGLSSILGDKGGLYEYSAEAPPVEALRPVGVPPAGGAPYAGADLGTAGTQGVVSADGSRVFFGYSGHLYARINATEEQSQVSGSAVDGSQCTEPAKACTIQLDALQGGVGGGSGAAFQFATPDGSRAFFTDDGRLTVDSTAQPGKSDLYEYDLARPLGQRLADLTVSASEPAAVRYSVVGASSDGSFVYFAAFGDLTGGEENAAHEKAVAGQNNLYLWREGKGVRFIATLGVDELTEPNSRVSPNGRFLAFMSLRSLTGYDNRDALSGQPDLEVFLYNAEANGGAGRLLCASCDPTGARPRGVHAEGEGFQHSLVNSGGHGSSGGSPGYGVWFAASIPSSFAYKRLAHYRNLSDSGRLFFDSSDVLVPQDTNGTQDVYEYEPEGVGSCTTHDQTFHAALAGCVSLVSSGVSGEESVLLDASESGSDVFFLTAAQVVSTDRDSALDIYDAHVCSAESPCPPPVPPAPPECAGDACQGFVEAPNDPTPGSLTFQGAGDLQTGPSSGPPTKAAAKRKHKTVKKHPKKPRKTRKRATHSKRGGRK